MNESWKPTPGYEGRVAARERQVLFSAPMVRALLDGTKTQTRRAVSPASGLLVYLQDRYGEAINTVCEPGKAPVHRRTPGRPHTELVLPHCPYGRPGDRLWVREAWAAPHALDGHTPRFMPPTTRVHYAATEDRGGLLWRPSIHMPRWACRFVLTLESVRLERLHDISEPDAIDEGVLSLGKQWAADTFPEYFGDLGVALSNGFKPPIGPSPRDRYAMLWTQINGPGSWSANPWVWVLAFHCRQNLQPNF